MYSLAYVHAFSRVVHIIIYFPTMREQLVGCRKIQREEKRKPRTKKNLRSNVVLFAHDSTIIIIIAS